MRMKHLHPFAMNRPLLSLLSITTTTKHHAGTKRVIPQRSRSILARAPGRAVVVHVALSVRNLRPAGNVRTRGSYEIPHRRLFSRPLRQTFVTKSVGALFPDDNSRHCLGLLDLSDHRMWQKYNTLCSVRCHLGIGAPSGGSLRSPVESRRLTLVKQRDDKQAARASKMRAMESPQSRGSTVGCSVPTSYSKVCCLLLWLRVSRWENKASLSVPDLSKLEKRRYMYRTCTQTWLN